MRKYLLQTAITIFSLNCFAGNPIFKNDKAAHWYAGALIAYGASEFTWQLTNKPGISCGIGGLVSTGITWGKEYFWDKKLNKGVYSNADGFTGTMGAVGGMMIFRVRVDLYQKKHFKLPQKSRWD